MSKELKSLKHIQNQSRSRNLQKLYKADQISMIQNNLKEMRNEVDQFLKKGNLQLPPIIKARHYLYLSYINTHRSADSPKKDIIRSQSPRKNDKPKQQSFNELFFKNSQELYPPIKNILAYNGNDRSQFIKTKSKRLFQQNRILPRHYSKDQQKSVNFKTISFESINPENKHRKQFSMNQTFLSRQSYSRKIQYLSKLQKYQTIGSTTNSHKPINKKQSSKNISSSHSPKFAIFNFDKDNYKKSLQNKQKKLVQKSILLSSDGRKFTLIKEAQNFLSRYQQLDLKNYKDVIQQFNPMRSLVLPESKDLNDSLLKANEQLSKQFNKRYRTKVSSDVLDELEDDYKRIYQSKKMQDQFLKQQHKSDKHRKQKIKRKPLIKQLGVFSNKNSIDRKYTTPQEEWSQSYEPWNSQIQEQKIQ